MLITTRTVVPGQILVTKEQIVGLLSEEMPCGEPADFEQFADMLTDGSKSVTVKGLLVNAFVNVPLPVEVKGGE